LSRAAPRTARLSEESYRAAQISRGDRLREKQVEAGGLGACDLLGKDGGAQGDDRHAQSPRPQATTDLEAIRLRQLYVEEDQIEPIRGAPFARLAISLGDDLVSVRLERRLEELDVHRIVLNEENAQAASRLSPAADRHSAARPDAASSRVGRGRSAS